jgi:hypothetical protein
LRTLVNRNDIRKLRSWVWKLQRSEKKVLGEEYPYLTSLSNLLVGGGGGGNLIILMESRKIEGRREVLEMQVMESRKRILGEKHPDFAQQYG